MLTLTDLIRYRVHQQLGDAKRGIGDIVDHALWLYGMQGLASRGYRGRGGWKHYIAKEAVVAPIDGVNRYLTRHSLAFLLTGHQQQVEDTELWTFVKEHPATTKQQLVDHFGSKRRVTTRLRKAQKNWNILRSNNCYWCAESLTDEVSIQVIVLSLLERYDYLTLAQLEYLSGLPRFQLLAPIKGLVRENKIFRGITRMESPDEIFATKPVVQEIDKEGENYPVLVLEHRDPLVELIKLERGFTCGTGELWVFVDGIPQAEFSLERQGHAGYSVKNLQRFITTTYSIPKLLQIIKQWGVTVRKAIEVTTQDDPLTQFVISATQQLLDRGYQWKAQSLLLGKHTIPSQPVDIGTVEQRNLITWNQAGLWARNVQCFNFSGSIDTLLRTLGPLEIKESIAYRMKKAPKELTLNEFIYTPGINYRMSFIHPSHIEEILAGWPRQPKISYLDKQILAVLSDAQTTTEIAEKISSHTKLHQRLRYLEQMRLIRRLLPDSGDFQERLWVKFSHELDLSDTSASLQRQHRQMPAVGTILTSILHHNPPLTMGQSSRFLGIQEGELKTLFAKLTREGTILEGYYLDGSIEKQYTVPSVLDDIYQEVADNQSAYADIDLLPIQDTFSQLHLPPLVIQDRSIQITSPPPRDATQWMLMWQGQPIGYFFKIPSYQSLVDYELALYLTRSFTGNHIIAGALQQIVSLFRIWYNEEGMVSLVNGESAKNLEELHFLMDSIGIGY